MQNRTYTEPMTNRSRNVAIQETERPFTISPITSPRQRRPQIKHAFAAEAMTNLSLLDQLLFEHFGQGPTVSVPYTMIHRAFEMAVRANPHATAATHHGASITYGELERQANRLAALLADHGVTNGDNVALFLQRSLPMVVGIMATLKVGAAYVPQDARVAPEAQLRHIAQTTGAKVILTISALRHLVPVADHQVCIEIDRLLEQPFANRTEYTIPHIPEHPISPNDRCFILFTSGTTGNPNGVQVTHGNVCNILLTQPGDLGIKPGMKVGQILSISFDMAAWEILGALSHGATLVIRGKDFMETARQVDVIIATPSILSTLDAEQCHNVQVVAVAGEPCPQPLAE
ncbi:MAG: AMP-binding protein, partial [Caldilineaceae bacterium]|nr:AMP-binding protein [Caldilineaceae bacterium]